jgi:hypothetical protein
LEPWTPSFIFECAFYKSISNSYAVSRKRRVVMGLDSAMRFHSRQAEGGATVLLFPSRPKEGSVRSSVREGLPVAQFGSRSAALNRPTAVFREMAWAFVIPLGIVLMLRLAFTLFRAM